MKYIKIRDSKGNDHIVRLYSTKRSKNVIAVRTAEDKTLYAGSGTSVSGPTVIKVQTAAGTQNVCEYADDIPNATLIASYTTTQDVALSKDMFPLGGIITANGARGASSYGSGGKGSSATMYFGQLLDDTVLHVTIGVNNGSAGASGTNISVYSYEGNCSGGAYGNRYCPSSTLVSSANATDGGAGGKGSRATLDSTGITINAYGGGGGGGNRGSLSYIKSCTSGNTDATKCTMGSSTTGYGNYGTGGAAGNGAAGSGTSGGSAGSSVSASVNVYAFTE